MLLHTTAWCCGPSSGSSSLWKPIESVPSRYRLASTELNSSPAAAFTALRTTLSARGQELGSKRTPE